MVMKSTASSPEPSPNSRELKYKGVRKRKWGKWVSEIRLPNSRERIWLGSFDSPEKAARAFDAAQICLRGPSAANLNFPDNPRHVDGAATGLSPAEIQLVAARFANSDGHPPPPPAAEEVASVSTESVSVSEGVVQWEGGDVSFNDGPHPHPFTNYYDFNPLVRLGSGNNYEAEFGFGDFYTPEDSDSLDYYGFDQWSGSGCENSFLWNF